MSGWTWDPQRMAWTADFGPMRAEVWSQGGWPWIVGVRGKDGAVALEVARNVKICPETLDPFRAKLAAETAARQYADAIRAALPSPAAPDPEAVERRLPSIRLVGLMRANLNHGGECPSCGEQPRCFMHMAGSRFREIWCDCAVQMLTGQTANEEDVPPEEMIAAIFAAQEAVPWEVDGLCNQVSAFGVLAGHNVALMDKLSARFGLPQPVMPSDVTMWAGWLAFHIQETP